MLDKNHINLSAAPVEQVHLISHSRQRQQFWFSQTEEKQLQIVLGSQKIAHDMTVQSKKILSVDLYKALSTAGDLAFNQKLRERGYVNEVFGLGTEGTLSILIKSFLIPKYLSGYSCIITREYFSSFGINLRLILTRSKTRHVVIGLNQSRRLLRFGIPWVDRLIDAVFRRSDLVVVNSRWEAVLFNKLHSIPSDRFHFSPWGYDLPISAASQFAVWRKPYVCLVGRNNRDMRTFAKALSGMEIDGIIITSRQNLPTFELPSNVYAFADLSLSDTLDCIKQALANVVLVNDDDRGAGHITVVSAMFVGTPLIVSDVEVIKDYVVNGVSAITVPLQGVEAFRAAVVTVANDAEFGKWLSANAKEYAERWLTNERVSERLVDALIKSIGREKLPFADPEWLRAYEAFARGGRDRHVV